MTQIRKNKYQFQLLLHVRRSNSRVWVNSVQQVEWLKHPCFLIHRPLDSWSNCRPRSDPLVGTHLIRVYTICKISGHLWHVIWVQPIPALCPANVSSGNNADPARIQTRQRHIIVLNTRRTTNAQGSQTESISQNEKKLPWVRQADLKRAAILLHPHTNHVTSPCLAVEAVTDSHPIPNQRSNQNIPTHTKPPDTDRTKQSIKRQNKLFDWSNSSFYPSSTAPSSRHQQPCKC